MVRDRSYFHGLNPEFLGSIVEQDPVLVRVSPAGNRSPPGAGGLHERVYLVWALCGFVSSSPGDLLTRGQAAGWAG